MVVVVGVVVGGVLEWLVEVVVRVGGLGVTATFVVLLNVVKLEQVFVGGACGVVLVVVIVVVVVVVVGVVVEMMLVVVACGGKEGVVEVVVVGEVLLLMVWKRVVIVKIETGF